MQLTAGLLEGVLGFSPHSVFWVQMLKEGRNKRQKSYQLLYINFIVFLTYVSRQIWNQFLCVLLLMES